ncbi:MAG: histidine triad nucleotide-binding protein [Epsilonproteobacteria bacterium]|nr:histidine triad nucleotide-binding protein [Campylobacterota bacterium]
MKTDCIFCKIIAGQLPTKPYAEYDDILVIRDIAPKAPTHLLIMPKKHIHDIASVEAGDMPLVARMITVAQEIAQDNDKGKKTDFRLMINNGAGAGQSVFHLHMHFLAGKQMSE